MMVIPAVSLQATSHLAYNGWWYHSVRYCCVRVHVMPLATSSKNLLDIMDDWCCSVWTSASSAKCWLTPRRSAWWRVSSLRGETGLRRRRSRSVEQKTKEASPMFSVRWGEIIWRNAWDAGNAARRRNSRSRRHQPLLVSTSQMELSFSPSPLTRLINRSIRQMPKQISRALTKFLNPQLIQNT